MFSRAWRIGLVVLLVAGSLAGGVVVGAIYRIAEDDGRVARVWKLASRRVASSWIAVGLRVMPGAPAVAPLPRDGEPGFHYADPRHPYFARVRRDPRLRHLYRRGHLDLPQFVRMAGTLRGRFRHGLDRGLYHQLNVLELLDLADEGERFACTAITRMLIQLVQAGGGAGRFVMLEGHTVAELWSDAHGKWVVVDPDYDVHFTDPDGTPLSAWEIHRRVRDGARDTIVARPGGSPNALYTPESEARLLDLYAPGFGISHYAGWVGEALPRWHPARSNAFAAVYVGDADFETRLGFARVVADPGALYAPPASRPGS